MRTLGSAVLVFEWMVLALAVPVAVNVSDVPEQRAWAALGVATVLIVAAIALLPGPVGRWLGWAVQGVAVLSAVVVPMLAILAIVFAGLYYAALRLGASVDRVRAERAAAERDGGPGTMAGPDPRA